MIYSTIDECSDSGYFQNTGREVQRSRLVIEVRSTSAMASDLEYTPTSSDADFSLCSDPMVLPSVDAPERLKELWWLHGHPHSKRYSDESLDSLAALVRHNGKTLRGKTAFLHPIGLKPSMPYNSMTWDEFDTSTEQLAYLYGLQLKEKLEQAKIEKRQPTVAMLGQGITIHYFCTQLALQKLGCRVLLLAESNTTAAVYHLLKSCNACAVVVDERNLQADVPYILHFLMIKASSNLHDDFHKHHTATTVKLAEIVKSIAFRSTGDIWDQHSFIIHSSGSTGMPKPIIHTNRSLMLIARMYRLFPEFEVSNWYLLFPLYVTYTSRFEASH